MNPETYWKPNHRKKAQNVMIHFIDSSETFFSLPFFYYFFIVFSFRFMSEWINNVINGNLKTEFSHIFSPVICLQMLILLNAPSNDFLLVFWNLNFYSVMAFNFFLFFRCTAFVTEKYLSSEFIESKSGVQQCLILLPFNFALCILFSD